MKLKGSFDAVILAGGFSTRMGTDKAGLSLFAGGPTLIEWLAFRLSRVASSVIVVSSRPETPVPPRARVVPDAVPGVGALGGIYSGLLASATGRAFIVATDMPLVNLRVVLYMAKALDDFDALVPFSGDRAEPLHAFYRATCLPAIERAIARGDRRIISFFPEVRVAHPDTRTLRRLDPHARSFLNVNTPEEWQSVRAMVRRLARRYWRPTL